MKIAIVMMVGPAKYIAALLWEAPPSLGHFYYGTNIKLDFNSRNSFHHIYLFFHHLIIEHCRKNNRCCIYHGRGKGLQYSEELGLGAT